MNFKVDKSDWFLKIYFKKIVIFGFVLVWIFTAFPQIFDFPPPIQEAKAATEVLRPNGAGFYQEWETLVGSSHWEATSDQSDATYIQTEILDNIDTQQLADPTFSALATINSVTIYARIYSNGSAAGEKVAFFDRLGTTDRETGNITITRDSFNDYDSGALTVDPDGVAWTKTSISALEVGIKDTTLGASDLLQISEIWISVDYTAPVNNAPDTPAAVNPSPGSEIVTLTPTLSASVFSDFEEDAHAASQWQITATSSDYTSPVFDSGEDTVNLTGIAVSTELDYNIMYFWRVRYKDDQGDWSDYSPEAGFFTSTKGVAVSIEKGGEGEYGIGETAVIMAQVNDSIGAPINTASTTLTVFDPTKTKVLDEAPMTYLTDSNGLYYYDYPITAPIGVYIFHIETLKTITKLRVFSTGILHVAPWIVDIERINDVFVAANGTAESGTVSALVDSNLTEPDDFWNSMTLVITSGTNIGEIRYISDFNNASSTLTVDEPFSSAIDSTSGYLIRKDLDFAKRAASAVWDESRALHTITSSFGYALQNPVSTTAEVVQAVWSYSTRTLTDFGTLTADIWSYSTRNLTDFGTLVADIWSYSTRTLTDFGSLAADIWDDTYAPVRRLTSRQIGPDEYIAGVSSTSTVSQVADQSTQENVEYNIELVRAATFDFAGFADSGTTLTLVDAELIQPDDYWNEYRLQIISGLNVGEERTVSDFDASSDTIIVSSEFTNPVSDGDKYVLLHEQRLVNRIWNATTRSLTTFGTLATDVWSDVSAPIRRLTDKTLTGGGSLATETYLDTLKSDLITEINENETLITNLNNISATEVWSYAIRGLTEGVDLTSTSTKAIWDVAKSQLTTVGSVGKQVVDNLDVVVSTRSTLTAADVWSEATRTLTSNANFNDPDSAAVAAAVWSEATRELTGYGNDITAEEVWNVLSTNLTATGTIGRQLTEGVDVAVSTRASQASLDALNNISATEVWSYAIRGLTEDVELTSTSTKAIWDVAKSELTTAGSVGKQVADNLDVVVSTRSTLTAADVWNSATRSLTDYATSSISLAVWSEATRELTSYGNDITAEEVWNVLSNTLTLQDSIGKQLTEGVDVAVSTRASQASLDALNNISATDVWSYASRDLTGEVDLTSTSTDAIWEYALTQIGDAGSIGTLLKDNIDATVSSRGTSNLTAADVWSEATRTLTSNANFNDPDSAAVAAAVWSEATRELTGYGNDITAEEVWNVLSTNLTATGTIGRQLAVNVDVAISTRSTSTLTAADVWGYTDRSLTDFGTLVADIWSNSTRSLTTIGSLAADIWNDTFAPTRRLTDQTLTGGGSIATEADVTAAKDEIIVLINALNDISSADVWAYSNRSLTDPDSIWEYALTQIGDAGSIGLLLKDNIDATISSRSTSTLTANDVWTASVRTLTSNINLGVSTTEEIVDAIWDEALSDHLVEGSTGATLSEASAAGAGGLGGLTIETHTVSEFELGDTVAAATVQVKNDGVPVSGVAPTGVYYDPSNSAKTWPGEGGSTVNFTEIGSTGIYTHNFDTTGSTLGVYKLAVQASQSSGGSSFTDDFEDGNDTGWGNTGATYVVTADGAPQYNVYQKTDWGGFHYAFYTAGGDQADFTYEAKVRIDGYGGYVGIAFRYSDPSNTYDFYFRQAAGNVRLRKNGATLQQTASGSLTITTDVWYTLKVEVTGGNIKAYVDDVEQIDYTDGNPLPEGKVGLFTYNSIASWDDIDVTAAGTSETAYIAKDFAIVSTIASKVWDTATSTLTTTGSIGKQLADITTSTIASAIWDTATSTLTTTGSIGKAFADNRVVQFKANGEVLAGSGTNNYKAKLHLYDLSSQPINAISTPTITLYDSTGGVATGPTAMTEDDTGIYSYQYTIGSSVNTGRWEAVVTIDTGGANTIETSGYFEVEGAPARVAINSITDDTVPSITASIEIANEGSAPYEYQYEYCVVDTIGNACGGGDDIAYALSAELIVPGEENKYLANKTLTVNETGTYWYKVVVYWGTEKSVAILQFDAQSESEPEPEPETPPGGGGGGGGGIIPPPTEEEPLPIPTSCSGADLNKDGIVNSIDFSILLYFWKQTPPFANVCVDINKDMQVNSVDFSIMLFQWGKPGFNITWYNSNRINLV